MSKTYLHPSDVAVGETAEQRATRKLAAFGRRMVEQRLREQRVKARDREYLKVLRNSWTFDGPTLKSMLLDVNESFRIDPTPEEIDAAIAKL